MNLEKFENLIIALIIILSAYLIGALFYLMLDNIIVGFIAFIIILVTFIVSLIISGVTI